MMSTSSIMFWPTSATIMSPLPSGSNSQRYGLRQPIDQISGRGSVGPSGDDAYGLVDGMPYGFDPVRASTSMRSILPIRSVLFRALKLGSFSPPPSPVETYRYPSGPNAMLPALWFRCSACGTTRTSRPLVGSASDGSAETVYSAVTSA